MYYDVQGSFRGSNGTWELVLDPRYEHNLSLQIYKQQLMYFAKHPLQYAKTAQILYSKADQALDTEPSRENSVFTLALGNLQLEFNEQLCLQAVWGYLPRGLWKKSGIETPDAPLGEFEVSLDKIERPPVPIKIWKGAFTILFNEETGWLCLQPDNNACKVERVKIHEGLIIEFTRTQIIALWVKPHFTS